MNNYFQFFSDLSNLSNSCRFFALLIGLLIFSPQISLADIEKPEPIVVQGESKSSSVTTSNGLPKAITPEKATSVNGDDKDFSTNDDQDEHTVLVKTLLYLPNRVFDVLDIFRLRVRLGPGVGVGVRATEFVSANLGAYMTTYVGLPGPRQKAQIPRPVGFEAYAGGSLSVLNYETESFHPEYSVSEIGAHGQVFLAGVDVGFDPWEIVDFLGGIVGFDLREDDL